MDTMDKLVTVGQLELDAECHGEHDMVHKGERRHYPDASGSVYIALENTAYSPDTYPQHWKKVEK